MGNHWKPAYETFSSLLTVLFLILGSLLIRDMPRNERLCLVIAQQNGIAAMILALFSKWSSCMINSRLEVPG